MDRNFVLLEFLPFALLKFFSFFINVPRLVSVVFRMNCVFSIREIFSNFLFHFLSPSNLLYIY